LFENRLIFEMFLRHKICQKIYRKFG